MTCEQYSLTLTAVIPLNISVMRHGLSNALWWDVDGSIMHTLGFWVQCSITNFKQTFHKLRFFVSCSHILGQVKCFQKWPQRRVLQSCFNNSSSSGMSHHWENLAKVSFKDDDLSTKGVVTVHQVMQKQVNGMECMNWNHAVFVHDDDVQISQHSCMITQSPRALFYLLCFSPGAFCSCTPESLGLRLSEGECRAFSFWHNEAAILQDL